MHDIPSKSEYDSSRDQCITYNLQCQVRKQSVQHLQNLKLNAYLQGEKKSYKYIYIQLCSVF